MAVFVEESALARAKVDAARATDRVPGQVDARDLELHRQETAGPREI